MSETTVQLNPAQIRSAVSNLLLIAQQWQSTGLVRQLLDAEDYATVNLSQILKGEDRDMFVHWFVRLKNANALDHLRTALG